MIFNRYLLLFCAGYLTVARADSVGKELERDIRNGFKSLVSLLNKSFDDSCKVHVTGFGKKPITTVFCGTPGGYAVLTADGNTADPTPTELQLCEFGDEMKTSCKTLMFPGGVATDLEKAYAFIHGLYTRRTLQQSILSEFEGEIGTGFKRLVSLLDKSFHESCKVHVTGFGKKPITTVFCGTPGGYAVLTAEGNTADPTPTELQLCEYGDKMKPTCKTLMFSGTVATDLEKAYAFIHGLYTRRGLSTETEIQKISKDYKDLLKLLNKSFDDSCKIHESGEGVTPITPTISVFCSTPGGYAILTAEGDSTFPTPTKLELCGYGTDMKSDCKTLEFSGTVASDLEKAYAFIHGLLTRRNLHESSEPMNGVEISDSHRIVGTDYDMLVELLNGVYHNNCKVRVTGMRPSEPLVFFVCNRSGGYASLTSKGATNPVPTKFSVCEQGDDMKGKCDSVDLSGDTTKDIPAVKKVLGIKN